MKTVNQESSIGRIRSDGTWRQHKMTRCKECNNQLRIILKIVKRLWYR